MRNLKMNKLKYFVAVTALFLAFSTTANAQTTSPTPDVCSVFVKAAEEAADLAKRKQIEIDSLKAQLVIEKDKVTLEKERTANKEEQVQFYKLAYEKGTKIDTNATMIIENLRFQLNDYKNEVSELRRENDKLRDSRTVRTFIGFGAGLGAGYYLGNKK